MPLASMTGFARTEGVASGLAWAWEMRSVNGRGLEVRLRLAPGFDAAEPALREEAARSLRRGNVSANLAVRREDGCGQHEEAAQGGRQGTCESELRHRGSAR